MKSLYDYIIENKNTEIVKVPSVYRHSPDEDWRFLNTSYIIKDSDIKDSDFEKYEGGREKEITYNLKYRIPFDPDERDLMGWHTTYEEMMACSPAIGQDYRSGRYFICPADNSGTYGNYSTFEEAKKALIKHINEYRQMKRKQNKK